MPHNIPSEYGCHDEIVPVWIKEVSDTMHGREVAHHNTELTPEHHELEEESHPKYLGKRANKENENEEIGRKLTEIPAYPRKKETKK
jgi:hypothetical protein